MPPNNDEHAKLKASPEDKPPIRCGIHVRSRRPLIRAGAAWALAGQEWNVSNNQTNNGPSLIHFTCLHYLIVQWFSVCAATLPDYNVYWLYPSPAFPAADYGGSALFHTAHHHTIIITDHGCRHPNLLTDSQAVMCVAQCR